MRISQHPQVALGRAVRLRREEIGMTQEALADAADLDATSIRGIERGIANPTWDVADRIARALRLALHELARSADALETRDRQPTDRPLGRQLVTSAAARGRPGSCVSPSKVCCSSASIARFTPWR